MRLTHTQTTFVLSLLAAPACSLIIDTTPDGVIRGGASGEGGDESGGTATAAGAGGNNGGLSGTLATARAGTASSVAGAAAGGPPISIAGAGGAETSVAGSATGGPSSAGTTSTVPSGGTSGGSQPTGGAPTQGGVTATGGSLSFAGMAGSDSGKCAAGNQRCGANSVPQLCSTAGIWQDQTACGGATPTCSQGLCVCAAGTSQCKADGVTPQFCTTEGLWQDRAACSGTTPVCNGAGACGECKIQAKKCESATPYVCSDAGLWQAQTTCSGSTPFCAAGSCTATCPGNGGPAMKLLPEGYCIDTTEVTREQYYTWIVSNPVASAATQIADCAWNGSFVPGTDAGNDWPPTGNYPKPVTYIDWCDAYAYCAAVGKRLCGKIGGGPFLTTDFSADPYASEWINACSSHGVYDYNYGDTFTDDWCNGVNPEGGADYVATSPKCQSPIAAYAGIYDLSGNVEEWENNCAPGTGISANCTTRGGSYNFWDTQLMCTSTYIVQRSSNSASIGFRCCSS